MTSPSTYTPVAEPEGRGGRVVLLLIAGLIVLFGGLYVAAYAFAGDRLPEGSRVGSVDVGGRSPEAAAEELRAAFGKRTALEVAVDGRTTRLSTDELGLALDVDATVEAAGGGRSWAPADLWDHYTGGNQVEPVVQWDESAFSGTMGRLDEEFGTPAREGDVRFQGAEVTRVRAEAGEEIDRTAAREALETAYVEGERAELALVRAEPEVDDSDVQEALDAFGNPAVSGPVTLSFDGTDVRLQPADYTPAIDLAPRNGELAPVLDEKKLDRLVRRHLVGRDDAPVDATVRLVDGRPKVIPSKPGVDYRPEDISAAFLDVVVRPLGERTLAVKATTRQADFTTAEARKLRIRERVSTFSTHYPHAEYRNVNIGRAAELVDGTVLKPGETFSLNETVGERTAENGFTEGFIISNGVFKEDLGGGVSQMATTTFNAAFFAGLEDVEHKPHSFYIDRYPVGREATVAWPTVDLKFKNTTPYGILIQAWVEPSTPSRQGTVTVSMWSTKYWDISTRTSRRYNFTSPGTRTMYYPDCVPNEGFAGFDVDVWRYFKRHGEDEVVRTEKFHTTYTPSDTVICRERPQPEPEPEPEPSPEPTQREERQRD